MAAALKVRMGGTIIWNGKKYGPGSAVQVPADLAEAFHLKAAEDAPAEAPKAARKAPASDLP